MHNDGLHGDFFDRFCLENRAGGMKTNAAIEYGIHVVNLRGKKKKTTAAGTPGI